MSLCQAKTLNIFILVFTVLHLVHTLILAGFTISYFSLYDSYYFLVDNPLAGPFMTMSTLALIASISSGIYSLYVSDKLAEHFAQQKQSPKKGDNNSSSHSSSPSPTAASEYMSTFLVKVVKGISMILALILLIMTAYDLSTSDALFLSKGILKSLQEYKADRDIKVSIDRLQMDYHCCGHLSYTNWTDDNVDMEPGPWDTESLSLRYIPFSCCNISSSRPCVREFVEQNQASINYYFPDDLSIYSVGCSVVMKSDFESILRGILFTILPVLVLEVLSMICFVQMS